MVGEMLKELTYFTQHYKMPQEQVIELMKVAKLRKIGNMLSLIESELSDMSD